MFKIKKIRKDSAGDPGALVSSVEEAASEARRNMKWLIAGVALALLAGAAVGGFFWKRQQDNRAAADLLHEATKSSTQRLAQTGMQPARRPEEIQKTAETLRKLLADFPDSSVAPQALYLLGNAQSDLKEWDGALQSYQKFLARYGNQPSLAPLVYQRMAYTLFAQGKMEDAQKTFAAILQLNNAPNKDQALFELGRISEILGQPEGALAHYQQIVKDHPQSLFASEAAIRIKTLDARKAVPPSAAPAPPPRAPAVK